MVAQCRAFVKNAYVRNFRERCCDRNGASRYRANGATTFSKSLRVTMARYIQKDLKFTVLRGGTRGGNIEKKKKRKKERKNERNDTNDSLVSSCCSHKTMCRKNGGVSKEGCIGTTTLYVLR